MELFEVAWEGATYSDSQALLLEAQRNIGYQESNPGHWSQSDHRTDKAFLWHETNLSSIPGISYDSPEHKSTSECRERINL